MPAVDMPLEELKTYGGINPRPDDFDAYWEKALAELDRVDPEITLEPAAFQVPSADCLNLRFTGTGGSRIHMKYIRPKGAEEPHPAVVIFHGYSGRSPEWSRLMSWAAAGYSVLAMDCRGQGGLSENTESVRGTTWNGQIIRGLNDSPESLLYRHIFLDTVRAARIAMERPEVDPARVGCLGLSQGGALTTACAALEPRIRRAAPLYPFLSDYKRVWDMDLGEKAYAELSWFFRSFDPAHEREEEIFRTLGYIDIQNLAPRIKGEILFGTGLMDTVCPPSSQFAAYNKITAPKQMVVYPDFGHENIPDFSDRTYRFMMDL